jgi:acetyl-CoA C-acetyltransferase
VFRRTPVCKAGRELASVDAVTLAATAARAVLAAEPRIADAVTHAVYGSSRIAGQGVNPARRFALAAGLPEESTALTVTCACASGFEALLAAWRMIALGEARAVLVGAGESMSGTPRALFKDHADGNSWAYIDLAERDGLTCSITGITMPEMAEAIARAHGISRTRCEAFAARSHACYAQNRSLHAASIVPVEAHGRTISADSLPRNADGLSRMAELVPLFPPDGVLTAATASAVADGGAALIVCHPDLAPTAPQLLAHAVVGIRADEAPLAPVPALRALAVVAGIPPGEIGHIEINEGFAPQAIACADMLGLSDDSINRFGGTLAIGHPTGMTPLRLIGLASDIIRRSSGTAAVSAPVSGGLGFALLLGAGK